MEDFFNFLGKNKEKTAYGQAPVEDALKIGAVDKLFISKKLDKKLIRDLEKKATETAVKIEFISMDTDEGKQFFNLGGVGAILRFKVK